MDFRFEITDDSGLMALIDLDAYQPYVTKNWTLELLGDHFREQMMRRALLIWGTPMENTWDVEVTDVVRSREPDDVLEQLSGPIRASQGRLHLINYESLTMAARYRDVSLPEWHLRNLTFAVPPGDHTCEVTRLQRDYPCDCGQCEELGHDPDGDEVTEYRTVDGPDFVLTLTPGGDVPLWTQVPWERPEEPDWAGTTGPGLIGESAR